MAQRHERRPARRQLRQQTLSGTRAAGANYGGTVTFPAAFSGTPVVVMTTIYGSLGAMGTGYFGHRSLRVSSAFSGSFTWRGSPRHGTFGWIATGQARTG